MSIQTVDQYGSFITTGPHFSVLQCRGPVRHRQMLASSSKVICYAEHHLNSHKNRDINHGFVVTGKNIPKATERWASEYLAQVEYEFVVETKGIVRGVPGAGCVQWVTWPTPTMLLEPLFLSHDGVAEVLSTPEGREALGRCLSQSIIRTFAKGGLVGFSIGHAYRNSPTLIGDPGALFPPQDEGEPDWDEAFDTEAEVCEDAIKYATAHLGAYKPEAVT